MTPANRLALATLLLSTLAACGPRDAETEKSPMDKPAAAKTVPVDWSRCRFPGLVLPIPGRLFVVDGGQPAEDAEAGRESIRRVKVLVPGDVMLLLTAPDATAWHLQLAPETRLRAVFASGPQPQRITGAGLGPASRLERSQAMGDDCGRYWMAQGADGDLTEATMRVFGRPHDAVYGLVVGQVSIGDAATPPQSGAPDPVGVPPPATDPAPAPAVPEAPAPPETKPDPAAAAAAIQSALRQGTLRLAHADDLRQWKRRHESETGKPISDEASERLDGMTAYRLTRDFEIPRGLQHAELTLFLLPGDTPAPANPEGRSLVLDLDSGACFGRNCSFWIK